MKKFVLLLFVLAMCIQAFTQVSISVDNSGPDPSAMLDVKSTDKGFLPPRMTTEQMNGIITPPDGLIVYNSSVNSLYWFNGSMWKRFNEFNYTETDPVFSLHPASGITAVQIGEWNSAYGWGNHASAGYLTSFTETDPIFNAHPSSSITNMNISNWNAAYGWGNHAAVGYLTSYTETDPIFGVHPASGITSGNISDWNSAYSNRITTAAGTAPLAMAIFNNQLTGSITAANSSTNGYLTATDWNVFNNKQNTLTYGNLTSPDMSITGNGTVVGGGLNMAITKGTISSTDLTISGGTGAVLGAGTTLTVKKGNLTETTSSVLTINGGTNAVLGTGTSITVKQANTSQSGYLGSGDWNSFNNKVSSQWVTQGQNISYNSGKVSVGTTAPASSAIVDLTSTTSGFLLPRMTLDQRDAIPNPAEGLMVFCTNCGARGTLSVFADGSWSTFSPCTSPVPTPLPNVVTPGQIIWKWAATSGTTGYKWGTTTNYTNAENMSTSVSKTETGIVCDSTYTRYLWSYNACGVSERVTLTQNIPGPTPVTPIVASHIATSNSIVWKWHPVTGATGYKWSINNDFLTATDLGTDTTKTETGDTCGTTYSRYVWAYNGCGFSTPLTLTQSTISCWVCGISTITINHVAGSVAPVNKTTTYGTVTNIPGEESKCWITSNLGSDHQATTVDDATEASAGWYWQFNRKQGYKHDGSARTPNSIWISNVSETSDWNSANDPCSVELGSGWRLATLSELANVDVTGNWIDWNGPWNSGLKIHAAGYLFFSDGSLNSRGSVGKYWSSSQYNSTEGNDLGSLGDFSGLVTNDKAFGFTARCIRESCSSGPSSPTSGTHTQNPTQINWTWTTIQGATGYKWSTNNDFATATDMGTATSTLETGLTCNTAYNRYLWAYNGCGNSTSILLTQTTSACWTVCGNSITINHVAGSVSPVNKTTTYGTVTNIPGEIAKCWITSNLGSDHQATSVDDATEASAGWYWQFNRKQGYKHDGTVRTPNTNWISSISETSDWNSANDPCSIELGTDWRIPTSTEWTNVDANGNWTNWNGPWNSNLNIHVAGFLTDSNGSLMFRGVYGDYWSVMQSDNSQGVCLYIGNTWSEMSPNPKPYGLSIRCLRD